MEKSTLPQFSQGFNAVSLYVSPKQITALWCNGKTRQAKNCSEVELKVVITGSINGLEEVENTLSRFVNYVKLGGPIHVFVYSVAIQET